MRWLLAGAVAMLASCGILLSPNGPASSAPVLASMARQGCLGECPVYRVIIYTDGVVEYHGEQYVDVVGPRTGAIDASALDELRDEFARVDFARLGDFSEEDCTDLQQVVLTYQGKRIVHNWGDKHAPGELGELELLIDALTHSTRWVGDDHAFAQPDGSYCD